MRPLLIGLFALVFHWVSAQNRYELSGGVESPLLYSAAAGIGISIPIGKKIKPLKLGQINELDSLSINWFDRVSTTTFSVRAQKSSDVFFYGSPILPFTLLFDSGAKKEFGTLSAMYFETILVNFGITELVKVLVKRTRPYAYNGRILDDLKTLRDTRKSFFSGHTSHLAATSFFTARILADHHPGDGFVPLYWASAAVIPAVTAYLRVKGGKHFPTDVIVGYIVGALVGIFIPQLHKL